MGVRIAVQDLSAGFQSRIHATAVVLILVGAAPAARAQSAADLLGMLPAPASGDCHTNPLGAARKAHDEAMAKFKQAYDAAKAHQEAASKALADAVMRNPAAAASTNPRQIFALNRWLTEPGHLVVDQAGKALLDPPLKAAWAAESPIQDRASACEKSEKCDAGTVLKEMLPIQQKLVGELTRRWPLFIDSVRKALAYDQRPLPADLDPRALSIRMQVDALANGRFGDLKEAAGIAESYACVETSRMGFGAGSVH